MADDAVIYRADHVLEYPFVRSVGPVIGAFLTGLRDGKFVGTRGSGGRVIVPPTEYDPETGDETSASWSRSGPRARSTSWSWVPHPRPKHPLQTPFAWVLIRFDGADTAFLHVLAGGRARRRLHRHAGAARVRRPRPSASGHVRTSSHFVAGGRCVRERDASRSTDDGTRRPQPRLRVHRRRGPVSKFLRGLEQGKFIGQRCPKCKKVYVPSRGSCPTDGVPTDRGSSSSPTPAP